MVTDVIGSFCFGGQKLPISIYFFLSCYKWCGDVILFLNQFWSGRQPQRFDLIHLFEKAVSLLPNVWLSDLVSSFMGPQSSWSLLTVPVFTFTMPRPPPILEPAHSYCTVQYPYLLSTVYCPLSTVYCPLSTVHFLLSGFECSMLSVECRCLVIFEWHCIEPGLESPHR